VAILAAICRIQENLRTDCLEEVAWTVLLGAVMRDINVIEVVKQDLGRSKVFNNVLAIGITSEKAFEDTLFFKEALNDEGNGVPN